MLAFAGNPQEVCYLLDQGKDGQIVAVVLKDSNPREIEVVGQVLIQIVQLTQQSLATLTDDALTELITALLPKETLSPTLLNEARMELKAKEAVLTSGDWLNAAELASILGPCMKNPKVQLRRWRHEGRIFAIRHDGVDYFPGYAFDPHNDYRPHRSLKKVIEGFSKCEDGWRLAIWFNSLNGFLGGRCPKNLLAPQPDQVLAAVADEAIRASHA